MAAARQRRQRGGGKAGRGAVRISAADREHGGPLRLLLLLVAAALAAIAARGGLGWLVSVRSVASRGDLNSMGEVAWTELQSRKQAGENLMTWLSAEAGLVLHPAVEVSVSAHSGVGLRVSAPVEEGTVLLSLPTAAMVRVPGGETQPSSEAWLAVELARARRRAASESSSQQLQLLKLYMDTLPPECPNNIAVRPEADVVLVSASIHRWKTQFLQDARTLFKQHLPDATEEEMVWATCMVLSRALMHEGHGAVMMPFVDLINHGETATHRSTALSAQVVSARQMQTGDEISFLYVQSPSRARMLTSFGFDGGAPAASLVATGLPPRSSAWFMRNGCSQVTRTDLNLEASTGALSEQGIRDALRCIRSQLYTEPELEWARSHDHLNEPWAAELGPIPPPSSESSELNFKRECLQKDDRILGNTAMMCARAQTPAQARKLNQHLAAASPDLRAAIADETAALAGCTITLEKAHHAIVSRLGLQDPQK